MSTGTAPGRNRLMVPAVAGVILLVIIIGFLLARGDGDAPTEPKATASTKAPAPAAQDKLKGSGDAPEAITVKTATVARGANVFALGADMPDIDIKEFDTVDLLLGQDEGDVLWRLTTFRDSRGAFITPQLYREQDGPDEQFACAGAAMRIQSTRLTVTVPLACLDDAEKPLKARLQITDQDGGKETTTTSKTLKMPKA